MSTNEFAAFEALDLAPIKMKLMHVESGEGWSALRADAVETEYRRFLFLMKKYPDAEASPTVDVDIFWHYHILDTMKYARDCEALFGYFLHHYPYVGIGADEHDGDQAAAGDRMRAIYETEFGARPAANAAFAFCSAPGKPLVAANAAYAFCSAPGKPREAAGAAYAFCSAPGKPGEAANAAYAFCSAPGKPRESAGAAYAFCSAPGKPSQAQPDTKGYGAASGKELAHAA
ncbi:glycine-rich domain-containing protein [Massilia sp. UBA6681]|uniref:glycine-rich domain-containing protein n=1 Tax=Massilia sp. UBA6681 TaxID=1946839 RepID=UPI0025C47A7B|nr:glycine-rich domain-containing protein-like [Massilia sp. UBA6681]